MCKYCEEVTDKGICGVCWKHEVMLFGCIETVGRFDAIEDDLVTWAACIGTNVVNYHASMLVRRATQKEKCLQSIKDILKI